VRDRNEMIYVSTKRLDRLADRLGLLYKDVRLLEPDSLKNVAEWNRVFDEIVNLTVYVERLSWRKKRLAASRAHDEGEIP